MLFMLCHIQYNINSQERLRIDTIELIHLNY
jgi:hypothetical protein